MEDRDLRALELFRSLIRIPSTSHLGPSSGSYAACIALLESSAKERGLKTRVVEPVSGHPVLVCTKEGTDPSLPSLLLNSHYDVVPAEAGDKKTRGKKEQIRHFDACLKRSLEDGISFCC